MKGLKLRIIWLIFGGDIGRKTLKNKKPFVKVINAEKAKVINTKKQDVIIEREKHWKNL